MMLNNALTVDPGFHTGHAYWKGDIYPITGCFNLSRSKKIKTLELQCEDMWKKFEALVKSYNPKLCYIESVEHWGGSLKSQVAGSKGDLSKLSYLVGGYAHICMKQGVEWRFIPARSWKGQLPNKALIGRIHTINGQLYENDHILCAVGIGFSRMGLLNWKKKLIGATTERWEG